MVSTWIVLFQASSNGLTDTLQKALQSEERSSSQSTIAGLKVQDRNVVQLTSDAASLEERNLYRSLRSSCGEPKASLHVNFNNNALGSEGSATAPVLEVIANYFPASRVTPDFQQQIQADFEDFDRLCKTMANGDLGLSHGWSVDEVDHQGEKSRPFFILRGWQSMQDFENLTAQEKFRQEAIPKLMAWKAPFEMVSLNDLERIVRTLTVASGISNARTERRRRTSSHSPARWTYVVLQKGLICHG